MKATRAGKSRSATPRTRATESVTAAGPGMLFEMFAEDVRQDVLLGFLFHDVARMRRRASDVFMKPYGLTRAQWWVLASLARQDGMTQTALADDLEMGKANLGVVVESLEAGGWVKRVGTPSDMRAKRVFLTRAAVALVRRMFQAEVEFNELTLTQLTRKEREQLFKLLGKVKLGVSRLEMAPPARD